MAWTPKLSITALLFAVTMSVNALRLDLAPSSAQAQIPGTITLSLIASDLADQIVSSYDIAISYDPFLTALGLQFGAVLGGPADSLSGSDLSVLGSVTLFEVSLLGDDDLQALQGDSVTLATLTFAAASPGISSLQFDAVLMTGAADPGHPTTPSILDPTLGGARIEVVPGVVPEPGSLALLLAALFASTPVLRRRRGLSLPIR